MKYKEAKEEITKRVSIVEVINRYVPLKKSGSNYMGLCPFHPDKNPSMSVNEARKQFRCWAGSCNERGNVFYFLSKYLGISYFEAVKMLAKEVNIEIENDFQDENNNKLYEEKKQRIYAVNRDAANIYYKYLFSDVGKSALDYLMTKRKLTKETIKKFGLGYAPKNTIDLYNKLKEKGHTDEAIFDSTLFHLNEENKVLGYFYDRVMFPVLDVNRNILGFQSRTLDPDTKIRKYVNSKESIVFRKESILFGYNFAFHSKLDYYIVCEGNMDVITLNQAGYDNVVASQGVAFTNRQIDLFKRRPKSKRIYLCQDMDEAGILAKNKSADMLRAVGFDTYAIDLSPAKDVDEFINDERYGVAALEKRFAKPIPSILYYVSSAKNGLNLVDPYDFEKYIDLIVAKLATISNIMSRENYIREAAIQENIDAVKLTKLVNDYIREGQTSNVTRDYVKKESNENYETEKNEKNTLPSKHEMTFVSLIVSKPEYREQIKNIIQPEELKDKICRFLYEKYIDGTDVDKLYDLIENDIGEEKNKYKDVLDYSFNFDDSDVKKTKEAINILIRNIKIDNVNNDSATGINNIYERNLKTREIAKAVYLK